MPAAPRRQGCSPRRRLPLPRAWQALQMEFCCWTLSQRAPINPLLRIALPYLGHTGVRDVWVWGWEPGTVVPARCRDSSVLQGFAGGAHPICNPSPYPALPRPQNQSPLPNHGLTSAPSLRSRNPVRRLPAAPQKDFHDFCPKGTEGELATQALSSPGAAGGRKKMRQSHAHGVNWKQAVPGGAAGVPR